MEAKVFWQGELRFEGKADSNLPLIMDAAPEHGGREAGPRPMEVILMGLGGCTGMDVISILKKMKQEVKEFSISLKAERAEDHPKVFTKIILEYVFKGHNLEEDKIKRAIELSQTKYCPASAMLRKAVEITYRWKTQRCQA